MTFAPATTQTIGAGITYEIWPQGTVNVGSISGAAVSASTAQIGANVVNFGGQAGTFASGRPDVNTTYIAGSIVNTSSAQLGVNVVNAAGTAWNSGAIGATTIGTGAIDADSLAADASTEIRSLASGISDSGTTLTMVDAARTEADTDYWKGQVIVFTSGNILGQARLITGFNAATDTITFAPATTQAVATQTYEIWPSARVDLGQILGTTVDSTTSQIGANIVQISDDATAAANAELFFDGTGYAGTNNVIPTVTNVTTVNGLAANVITATSINADALTAAKVATDVSTEIAAAVAAFAGADPSAPPAVNAGLMAKIDWLCAWARNKQTMNRTTGVVALRNDTDTGTIGTYTASDDGTTFMRPEVT